jgi:uncharacterized tellurite resistance protein B-like protein
MNDQDREIIKSLAEMAWADGEVSPEERSLLVKVLIEAGSDPDDAEELDKLLARPAGGSSTPPLARLEAAGLDEERRLSVMRVLLIMSFMDGVLSFAEFTQIEKAQEALGISQLQLEILRAEAIEAAKALSASA